MNSYKNALLSPEERAHRLLQELTLREKVGQINQHIYGFASYYRNGSDIGLSEKFMEEVQRWGGLGVLYGLQRADPWSQKDYTNGLCGQYAVQLYNEVQHYVIEHSRLGIPVLMSEECPHGHQALDGYILPVNLALGSTWNPSLVGEAFSICAEQMSRLHIDMALVSMLDILRDPRWGRSEECYSEDPYLAAVMAKAVTAGILSRGVDVVAKHCCAQGETTGGVNASAARIGERELREIHLPPVKSAVEAGVMGIMAAYNEIDGVPCHANPWLLQHVLRDEFHFKGIVMADGCAIDLLNTIADGHEAQAAEALRSGVDVSLWDESFTMLEQAKSNGYVEESRLDEAVLRVLTLKFKRGLFEKPYIEENKPKKYSFSQYPHTLELARQSIVLLKNETQLLPLRPTVKSIAVISPLADDLYAQLGDYTPPQRMGEATTILEGIRRIAPKNTVIHAVTESIPVDEVNQDLYIKRAVDEALLCEVVVLVLGGSSSRFQNTNMIFADNGALLSNSKSDCFVNLTDCGEGVDVANLSLPAWQRKLLKALYDARCTIITVLLAGRPYAIEEVSSQSNALCYTFYPGPAGGQALAEILWGKVCPSGRLPASLPRTAGQIPVYYNYKASYSPRYSDCLPNPAYSFGYGLSYVKIELHSIVQNAEQMNISQLEEKGFAVSFQIKNCGNMQAYATPQLYMRDRIASTVPRVRMLKSFARVELLPGEEKECTLFLQADDFKIWNRQMKFVVEEGEFELFLYEGETTWWKGVFEIKARDTM